MVVLSALLAAAVLCILVLSYKLYMWKKAYNISTTGLAAHLKDAQQKLEDVDVWKKACWDAEKRHSNMSIIYQETDELLVKAYAEIDKVVNQKKSSEVRTGQIAEQLAPFISGFPYDPKKCHFLANPLDYVVFDDTGIHFVEVKSGESKLTEIQRRIKKDIEEKRVSFEIFRIK